MKEKIFKLGLKLVFTFGLLLIYSNANSQITSWSFDPFLGTVNNPTPNTGPGSAAVVNLGGGTVTPGSRTGMSPSSLAAGCGVQDGITAWALEPFDPGTSNESTGVQFNSSTVGYQNITFTWDQRWSNTASNTVRLQYTTNGSTWVPFTMTAGNTTFCSGSINVNGCFEANTSGDVYRRISVNFSTIPTANNNPNFGVRLLASYYQSTGQFRQVSTPASLANALGTWRFDNVSFNGTLLPGPTSSVISAVAPISICVGSSANIIVTITGGTGPFTVIYSDGTTNFTVTNYISASNISVTPASTKTYTIVSVANANGALGTGNSGAAVITVNPLPPVPTAGPVTVCGPAAQTLTVGSAPPLGHTGSYSIANPYSGPTTNFTYTITNTVTGCSRTSATYTFTRNAVPAITTQPSPAGAQTVCQGNPFSAITVVATGTSITYQWYRNTVASTVGATALTGALAFPLEIANGSKTATFTPLSNTVGTYYYYVKISGTCIPAVNSTVVGPFTVLAGAVGGTASNSQSVCYGAPADLTLTGFTNTVTKWQYATNFAFTTPIDIPLSASATLTSAQMGILTSTRYYRAVVSNGTCNAYSNVITVSYNTTTWNGSSWSNGVPNSGSAIIFNGNYSSSADLDACSVEVISGNILFNANHTLTVQNDLKVTSGTLTFNNNSSLVQVNTVDNLGVTIVNTGNIVYKRDTTGMLLYDYTYWSSPVVGQVLTPFSPNTNPIKFFTYDSSLPAWVYVPPATTTMTIGRGYIVRAPDIAPFNGATRNVFTGIFTGVPNTGTFTTPIFGGSNQVNLVGNPYPSAIYASDLMDDVLNVPIIDASFYLWTHNTVITSNNYTPNDYAIYNYMGGVGTSASLPLGANTNVPNGKIAAGQSFFVKGLAPGVLTFKNDMRVPAGPNNNDQFFRLNSETPQETVQHVAHRLWLDVSNPQGGFKQTMIGYAENATNGIDRGYDSDLLDVGNAVTLYSLADTNKLSIQGRPLPFEDTDFVPLGFKSTVADTFTISLSNFDDFFNAQNIYLEDKLLNVIHDLKNSNYIFTTNSGTFEDRFVLRFNNSLLNSEDADFNEDSIIIYKENQNLIINSTLIDIKNIEVYDLTGRLLIRKLDVQSLFESITIDGILTPILIVKIRLVTGQTIIKKIIT